MTIDEQSLTRLRERVALSKDFSPDERTLILDCLNLGDYSGKHDYPSRHGPDSSPWAKATWAVLDQLKPGKLSRTDRFMLGGMIAAALMQMFETGKRAAAGMRGTSSTEVHNPPNQVGQIDALYAALSVDAGGEGLCAGPLGRFGVAPLVVTDRRNLAEITEIARGVAQLFRKPVRMVRFTMRQELETIEP
jgi:hypothetical protein